MRFAGIRSVEQTEQKYHCFESALKKKTSDCNSRALLILKTTMVSLSVLWHKKSHQHLQYLTVYC